MSWLFPLSSGEQIKPPITNSEVQSTSAALRRTLTMIMNSLDVTIASARGPIEQPLINGLWIDLGKFGNVKGWK